MKITCPSCDAEYNVPDNLAAGRIVRCVKCSTQWSPVPPPVVSPPLPPEPPPSPEPEPLPEPPPAIEAPSRLVPPAPPPPVRQLPLLLAWAGSGVVIAAALVAAVVLRGPIMHGWPPSQRVYAAFGLHGSPSSDVHGDIVK